MECALSAARQASETAGSIHYSVATLALGHDRLIA
jgi:hypothetical protein